MDIKYLVLDIENDAGPEAKRLGRKAGSPLLGDPIIAIGMKNHIEVSSHYVYPQKLTNFNIDEELLIGHNLTHDLMWFWHMDGLQDFFYRGGRIWDTALVEYMLSGQQDKYPALRPTALKYGCRERPKLMEEYWDRGLVTSQIPSDIVLFDVQNDVLDTEQVFLKQYEIASKKGMLNLIELQNDALLATIEMSYNGFQIDLDILKRNKVELEQKLSHKKEQLLDVVKQYWR